MASAGCALRQLRRPLLVSRNRKPRCLRWQDGDFPLALRRTRLRQREGRGSRPYHGDHFCRHQGVVQRYGLERRNGQLLQDCKLNSEILGNQRGQHCADYKIGEILNRELHNRPRCRNNDRAEEGRRFLYHVQRAQRRGSGQRQPRCGIRWRILNLYAGDRLGYGRRLPLLRL